MLVYLVHVCNEQGFGISPVFQATWNTRVNQRNPNLFMAFNISGRISSSAGAMQLSKIRLLCSSLLRLNKFLHQFLPRMCSNVGLLLDLRARKIPSSDFG